MDFNDRIERYIDEAVKREVDARRGEAPQGVTWTSNQVAVLSEEREGLIKDQAFVAGFQVGCVSTAVIAIFWMVATSYLV